MYSVLAPSYVSYLKTRGKTDMANANKQEYISFMTGIYPSKGEDKPYNSVNAIDVHDYYMNAVLPKMLEESGKYKFEDNSWEEKVAEVTCNGETEIFKSFDEAWNYATKYTNTKITLCKDVEIKGNFKTSSAHKNNIEFDLQGHILTLSGYQIDEYFTVTNKGSLKLYSSNGTGSIVRTNNKSGNSCVNNENGTLKIENCIIKNFLGSSIINTKGNAEITNCTFKNNSSHSGGAIYSKAEIKIINCIFENNKSSFNGGAIAIYDGSSYISNCTFNNNIAERENGGAIYYVNGLSAPKISHSTFTNNYSHDDGGAIYVSAHTDIDIGNTVFRYNESRNIGGAIYLGQLRSTNHYFRNVTIEYNKCGKEGGGIFADACGCNTADIKLFGWNKIRYNTNAYGSASNAKMIKDTCRTVFKIMDDFDTYNSDIRGTTNSDGSCMVFLNTSSDYVYYYSYGMQSGAFRADNGRTELSGSGVYWYK
ncbi:MAG: right-handed parallel beta-helix repeat-containing protein [Ruminococcus sp.]